MFFTLCCCIVLYLPCHECCWNLNHISAVLTITCTQRHYEGITFHLCAFQDICTPSIHAAQHSRELSWRWRVSLAAGGLWWSWSASSSSGNCRAGRCREQRGPSCDWLTPAGEKLLWVRGHTANMSGDDETQEQTIADDLVVTKYKMGAEIANRKSDAAWTCRFDSTVHKYQRSPYVS